MTEVGAAVRAAREKAGISQAKLAQRANIAAGTVLNVEKGRVKPNGLTLWAIASALKYISWEALLADVAQSVPFTYRGDPTSGIPVLSEVPGGVGDDDPTSLGLDEGIGMPIPRAAVPLLSDPLLYALVVSGDSMGGTQGKYPNGTTVICSPHKEHESGRVYAIRFSEDSDFPGESTFKRVFEVGEGMLSLVADNPDSDWKTRTVPREHIVRMDRIVATFSTTED